VVSNRGSAPSADANGAQLKRAPRQWMPVAGYAGVARPSPARHLAGFAGSATLAGLNCRRKQRSLQATSGTRLAMAATAR
jgi:hypothetical protein